MPAYKSVFVEATAVLRDVGWAKVGTASAVTAVADTSDATYVDQSPTADWAESTLDFTVADPVIPAGAKIDSVHSHLRARETTIQPFRTFPQNWLGIGQRVDSAGRIYVSFDYLNADTSVFTDFRWGHASTPRGTEWTVADLNGLILVLQIFQQNSVGYGNLNWEVGRARFEIWYNERPTVTVSAPTGTLTTTVSPKVTYSYTDPENDKQISDRIKVVTDAVHAAAGFSWDTAKTVEDSGERTSGFGEYQIQTRLANSTTYWVGVQARQDWPRSRHTSAWAESSFTISLTPLTTPSLVTASQSTSSLGPRYQLTISGVTAANTTVVEYSDDAGTTWQTHPRLAALTGSTGYIVHDYELPAGTSRRYRVKQVTSDATNTSAYATSADVSLTFASHWLKDVQDANRNMRIRPNLPYPQDREENLGVFWPLVNNETSEQTIYPIIVSGGMRARQGSLQLAFLGDAEWNAFEKIRGGRRVLLYQNPNGGQMWMRLLGNVGAPIVIDRPGMVAREAAVEFLETRPVS